jgi:hypothetical protein
MRKTEIAFLLCVLGFAGLFAARSVTQSIPLLSGGTQSGSAAPGVAGQSRDVDMMKLKRLLDQRALSDREAEFYEPVGADSFSGDGEDEGSESIVPLEHGSDRTRKGD